MQELRFSPHLWVIQMPLLRRQLPRSECRCRSQRSELRAHPPQLLAGLHCSTKPLAYAIKCESHPLESDFPPALPFTPLPNAFVLLADSPPLGGTSPRCLNHYLRSHPLTGGLESQVAPLPRAGP
jgi:hypothetical protein